MKNISPEEQRRTMIDFNVGKAEAAKLAEISSYEPTPYNIMLASLAVTPIKAEKVRELLKQHNDYIRSHEQGDFSAPNTQTDSSLEKSNPGALTKKNKDQFN